jgi:hypothetical protein
MQIVNTTIVTTISEIKELIQYCLVHNFDGQINLTFEDNKIIVSEPSKEIAPDFIIGRFPVSDCIENTH